MLRVVIYEITTKTNEGNWVLVPRTLRISSPKDLRERKSGGKLFIYNLWYCTYTNSTCYKFRILKENNYYVIMLNPFEYCCPLNLCSLWVSLETSLFSFIFFVSLCLLYLCLISATFDGISHSALSVLLISAHLFSFRESHVTSRNAPWQLLSITKLRHHP